MAQNENLVNNEEEYNLDKTFAILTGIICLFIMAAGTTLGAYDALTRLGFVGILPVFCYLILDMDNIWAVYIDFKENGTPLEWTAWIVKGIASLFLLFVGGLVAFNLMREAKDSSNLKNRTAAYSQVYNECIQQNPKALTTCRKLAESQGANENKLAGKDKEKEGQSTEAYDKLLNWPLFHYLPGFLGVSLLMVMGFVKKLTTHRKAYRKLPDVSGWQTEYSKLTGKEYEMPSHYGRFTQSLPKASLDIQAYDKLSKSFDYFSQDGRKLIKLIPQASGYQIRLYDGIEKNKYIGHLGHKAYSKLEEEGITFEKLYEKRTPLNLIPDNMKGGDG